MGAKKQSFIERLTGTETVEDGDAGESGNVLSEKPWSPRLNNGEAEGVAKRYAKNAADVADGEDEAEQSSDEEERREEEEEEAEDASLAIDMYESENELIIQCMIAGVTPENLHVAITRTGVTIKGKRVAPKGVPEENYSERELYWGPFAREITLPCEIDTDGAEAVEKYGLLVIRLPKLDSARVQELKVRSVD